MTFKKCLIAALVAALTLGTVLAASAKAPDKVCESQKLAAVAAYGECLLDAFAHNGHRSKGKAAIARYRHWNEDNLEKAIRKCDAPFDRRIERAEATGICSTPGGASALRALLRRNLEDAVAQTTNATGCDDLDIQSDSVVCAVSVNGNAVDFTAIMAAAPSITEDTKVLIQAWGGEGGSGNTSNGGSGGTGGYAHSVTTVGDIVNGLGLDELYYYLGWSGSHSSGSGGDGGTGSMVMTEALSRQNPATLENTLVLAGGGGGGGGGRGTNACDIGVFGGKPVYGLDGANGGVAIPAPDATTLKVAGGKDTTDQDGDFLGGLAKGGNDAGGAAGTPGNATAGASGIAPVGGIGGANSSPQIGFQNPFPFVPPGGGEGGEPGDTAGGGAGGGGYGGGGGGAEGDANTGCVSGSGGGGGSFAVPPTAQCSGAPQTRPNNPKGGLGWVQFVFYTGSTCGDP